MSTITLELEPCQSKGLADLLDALSPDTLDGFESSIEQMVDALRQAEPKTTGFCLQCLGQEHCGFTLRADGGR